MLLGEPKFSCLTYTIKTLTSIPKTKYEPANMAPQLRAF